MKPKSTVIENYMQSVEYQRDLENMYHAQKNNPCGRCGNSGHYGCHKTTCGAKTFHAHRCDCTASGGEITKKKRDMISSTEVSA